MQDKEFKDLLEKYTSGTASPEEAAWMEAAYLKWNEADRVVPEAHLLLHAAADIRAKVMAATMPKRVIRLKVRVAAAAAILLVFSSLLWLFADRFVGNPAVEITAGSGDIRPGGDRATLKLSNGTEIDLSNLDSGQVAAQQAGVKITKGTEGELIYELSDALPEEKSAQGYNTISTPRGGQYKVILPDSTQVWLNASSSLTYPTSFLMAGVRRVELIGEGYFEVNKVAYKGGSAIPFVVSTERQQIKVLGTHFNVNAYEDEPAVATTLLEGSVQLNGNLLLKPGQQAITKADKLMVYSVNTADFVDWKSGDFNLSNSDFRTIMRKISRWYDVEIVYDETAPEQVKLGGWISRKKNISSILNLIQKTGKVHFKLEGRRVTVSK